MNDELSTCGNRAEAISLLAADALLSDEADELLRHLASCEACRERFEQTSRVCAGLRAATIPQVEFDRSGIVARAMQQVADEPRPRVPLPELRSSSLHAATTLRGAQADATTTPRVPRWQRVALAGSTVALSLVVIGLITSGLITSGPVGPSPWKASRSSEDVVHVSPRVAPLSPPMIEEGSDHPTLIQLRRAAAVSDEALDRLLAHSSSTLSAEPFSSHSLWQESLQ